ncbi:MAG: TIGR01777 family protein [Planctomycetes bacterium]|nr:TIGR01777 family protein [Planctomycetota bacterium]
MKVAVTGSTGLVGKNLTAFLTGGGHEVLAVTRKYTTDADDSIRWDPIVKEIEREKLAGVDAVVHLAGENIGDRRWSRKQKAKIRDSRVNGTRFLAETLAAMDSPPKMLVCASAVGIYGDRGDEVLDESSPPGEGFLSEVCREWEAAAEPAREKGIRVVHLRFGVILTPEGGALRKMLLPFKLCAGGVFGNGRQFWSWIGIDDVISAILHALVHESLHGPVNVVAPEAVTNREFTRTLARVLRRPAFFPLPAFAARLLLGEMADALLLASTRVVPKKLLDSGFVYRHTDLETTLRHVLGR